MNASQTARQRARVELTNEIKEAARIQLAVSGADGLSLRAVARALGMSSSALYRYFPSRDDLLTALIIDAYESLGDVVETRLKIAFWHELRLRWFVICRSVREWAIDHPHEYALIFGSPVPDYVAPQATIEQAIRVPFALLTVLRDAWFANMIRQPRPLDYIDTTLAIQVSRVSRTVARGTPDWLIARGIVAWSQLFGMVSFELFGQFVGSVAPTESFFEHAIGLMADFVGL